MTEDSTIDDTQAGDDDADGARPGVVLIAVGGQPRLEVFALERGRARVGRGEACTVRLDERSSREHAELTHRDGRWGVRDLDSRNGTFVDGAQIEGEQRAASGALVRVGRSLMMLCDDVRPFEGITSESRVVDELVIGPRLRAALDEIVRAAEGGRVMILGESGSGKELSARAFHAASGHAGGAMIAVNCAAIPEGVADAMLFGSRRGAFSGAVGDRVGLVEAAQGGTLFLDEIGELDPQIQAKLLRVLESGEVLPVGDIRSRSVEFRLCAATHRDLRADVATGRFREDLYYRVARPSVTLPPLRDRREDIPLLVARALAAVRSDLVAHGRLVEACCLRPWPGNIRELVAELGRAGRHALARGDTTVRIDDLASDAGVGVGAEPPPPSDPPPRQLERAEVESALAAVHGNVSAAARRLGLHRTQLYRLMRRYELE